jgi:hypothetical protein
VNTPLEFEQMRASSVAVGLSLHGDVFKMIVRSNECKQGLSDLELPRSVRIEAMKELREINNQLAALGSIMALHGISA